MRGFPHAAFDVVEIVAHLLERECQRKDALGGVFRQVPREALAPDRGKGISVGVEGCLRRVERRWVATERQRLGAVPQILGDRLCDARERRAEPRLEGVGQRHGAGTPDHDEVVAQPQQGPQQRARIRLGRQKAEALMLRLARDGIQPGEGLAEAVLDESDRGVVPCFGDARE